MTCPPARARKPAAIPVFSLLVSGLLSGCAAVLPPPSFQAVTPELRPEVFFLGLTRSTGVLETAGGAPSQRFTVEGHGRLLPDGDLRLEQSVTFEGERAHTRTWVMSRLDAHHYTATLTDASGPVDLDAYGNLLHLSYSLKGVALGRMEQWLYLQPDGRTVVNEAVVRVAGLPVRRLSERITNLGGG